jgi:hypothetical protein
VSRGEGNPGRVPRRRFDPAASPPSAEERVGLWLQLVLALALAGAFVAAGWTLYKYLPDMMIEPWQKVMFQVGLAVAFVVFGRRARRLWSRLRSK